MYNKYIILTREYNKSQQIFNIIKNNINPIIYPSIEIKFIESSCLIDNMIQNLIKQKYNWLILTSVNGVKSLIHCIEKKIHINTIKNLFENINVAVIGNQTSQIFYKNFKIYPALMPSSYNSIDLLKKISNIKNKNFLLIQSNLASNKLYKNILNQGGFIDKIITYYTIAKKNKNISNINIVIKNNPVIVTFMSPSSLFYFILNIKKYNMSIKTLKNIKIACIGKYTALITKKIGIHVHIIPINSTLKDFINSIKKYILLKG